MAINPNNQGNNLGTQLLRNIENVAVENRVINLLLSTRSYQALPFYQKNGFKVYGKLKDMPFLGVDTYYLVKRLKYV